MYGINPVIKSALQEDSKFFRRSEISATVVSAVIAGQTAAVLTQPFDVVKTMMQADSGLPGIPPPPAEGSCAPPGLAPAARDAPLASRRMRAAWRWRAA